MLKCRDQTISIRNLKIPAIIGVYDHERITEQTLTLNIDLKISKKAIFISDRLCDTVDYASVANRLSNWMKTKNSHLIEHIAHLAVQELFSLDSRVSEVRLEIFKSGCIENADGASVQLNYVRDVSGDEAS